MFYDGRMISRLLWKIRNLHFILDTYFRVKSRIQHETLQNGNRKLSKSDS